MKKIIKKLKDRAGLTLTEMLVTVAILSLFSAACLTGMTTALSVRRDNIMANDAEILASMVTNYITNELRTASNIDFGTGGQVTYQSNESGFKSVTLYIGTSADGDDGDYEGQLLMRLNAGGTDDDPVQIFSEAAYSDKSVKRLMLGNLKFTQSADNVTVTFDVGYKNVDSKKIVALPTAHTEFTVGLMNYEAPDSGEPGPTGG